MRLWGRELKFTCFDWETKCNYDILHVSASFPKAGCGERRCAEVCAGTSVALVQPKAPRNLSCCSQQGTDWVGSTRAKGRSVLDTLKLERQKAPGAAQSWEIRAMSSWSAGGKARLPLPFPSIVLFNKSLAQLELLHPDLSQPQKALLYPFPKVTEVLSEQQGLETGVLLCREKHNASDFWERLSKAQVVPGKVKCRIFLIHCSVSAGSDTKRLLTWRWACEFWHRGPDYEMSWMNFA